MERQGFDPFEHTVGEVVDFMEQIESSEDFDANSSKPKSDGKNANTKKSNGNPKKGSNNPDGKKFCMMHGWNTTHTTEECHLIKGMVQNKKAKSGDSSNSNGKSSGNWKNKAAEKSKQTQKDLNTLIKKAVDEGIQKKLSSKKRKSSDEELDLNAIDLEGFNYEDGINDLNINSESDGEIPDMIPRRTEDSDSDDDSNISC
jgi:hypothetical protein